MRVLLAPHGSRGDVQPMLALAAGLRDRGHTAAFVAPSNFVSWIRASGFAAESNGIDVEAVLRDAGPNLHSLRWQVRHLRELTTTLFDAVSRHSAGADVIVGAGVQMASASVAEWRAIPCATIVFCPCAIPGSGSPPPPIRTQSLPRWANRLLWLLGAPLAGLALRIPINTGRATLGLPPLANTFAHLAGDRIIVAADRDLAPVGDDVPERAVATDAWILDEPAALEPRLAAFLDLDPSPVYIGFGSMVARDTPALASLAVAAVRALGRSALIAGGWAELGRHVTPAADLFVAEAVPHQAVLPRVAAAIHHGGAGTTTAAARAGTPQVLLPHILDQFYFAHRLEQMGLAPRAVPVSLVTADMLAGRLETALNDPRILHASAAFAPVIGARNGVGRAVGHLEQLVATGAPSA